MKNHKGLTAIGLSLLVIFCTFPILWMIIISLCKNPDFLTTGEEIQMSLQNYTSILSSTSQPLIRYIFNSIIISLSTALLATGAATLSAFSLTRFSFPGKFLIPILILALSMVPQVSIVGYLFKIMTHLYWMNTYRALILAYAATTIPLALWIMISTLSKIPKELDQSAAIDGATPWQILVRIVLPLAKPGIISSALLVFIYSFNEFLFALFLTIDYRTRTVPVGIALFEGLHGQTPWGEIMAASTLSIIPVLILAAFFQRHIIRGLTRGALKG